MALVAKYLARHRLREPRLLDSLGLFLLTRMEELNSKVGILEGDGEAKGASLVCGHHRRVQRRT